MESRGLFQQSNKKNFFLLGFIVLIGLGLRIYNLGNWDFWYDEIHSIYFADYFKHLDIWRIIFHPQLPFYYLLLSIWSNFAGLGEFSLRFLSVTFGIISILMMYQLGKIYFNAKVGLVAALLLSLSPFHIWYSQELRPYSLIALLAVAQAYFLAKAIEGNNFFWPLFTIVAILSLYTSYFFIFMIPAGGIIFFIKKYRHPTKRWLCNCFIILIVFIPICIFNYLFSINLWKNSFWIPEPTVRLVLMTFGNFNLGYNVSENLYGISVILFSILFIWGIVYHRREKKLLILLSFLFFSLIMIFLTSLWLPLFTARNLIMVFPLYYCIIAAGLIGIKAHILRNLVFLFLIFLSSFSLKNYYLNYIPTPEYPYHPGVHTRATFKPAVSYVKNNFQKGDIIAHTNVGIVTPFEYYSREKDKHYFFFLPYKLDKYERRNVNMTKEERPALIIDLREGIEKYNFRRMWITFSSWYRDGSLHENSRTVKEYIERDYVAECSKIIDGILINLYVKKEK